MNSKEALEFIYSDELNLYEYEEDMAEVKREIPEKEKLIIKDIMLRSNYEEERATEIAKTMVDFGYTIHEQEYFKLKKVIEILKKEPIILKTTFECWEYDEERNLYYYDTEEYDYDSDFEEWDWIKVQHTYSKEKFELLKEVFGND